MADSPKTFRPIRIACIARPCANQKNESWCGRTLECIEIGTRVQPCDKCRKAALEALRAT